MLTLSRATQMLKTFLIADIVLSAASLLAAVGGSWMTEQRLTNCGVVLAQSEVEMTAAPFACGIAVLAMPAVVVSWVGLFRFRPWSRWLYVISSGTIHLMALFIGTVSFSYAWDLPGAIGSLASVVTGLIVATAFFSPVSDRFRSMAEPTIEQLVEPLQ